MLNLLIVPFIVLGIIQYRKKKAKLLLIIGTVIFLSFIIYLAVLQVTTINGLKSIDENSRKKIEECEVLMDSVKYMYPEEDKKEMVSFYSQMISKYKYLTDGVKTNYYDEKGNIIRFEPSKKEIEAWVFKNKVYTEWYYLILNPILALLVSIILGIIIPIKKKNSLGNNT